MCLRERRRRWRVSTTQFRLLRYRERRSAHLLLILTLPFPLSLSQDVKTVQHMEQVNLKKYRITSVEDALSVLEEAGDAMVYIYIHIHILLLSSAYLSLPQSVEAGSQSRGSASLDRGLSYQTKASQAISLSQRGKKDALHFTLGVCLSVTPSLLSSSLCLLISAGAATESEQVRQTGSGSLTTGYSGESS